MKNFENIFDTRLYLSSILKSTRRVAHYLELSNGCRYHDTFKNISFQESHCMFLCSVHKNLFCQVSDISIISGNKEDNSILTDIIKTLNIMNIWQCCVIFILSEAHHEYLRLLNICCMWVKLLTHDHLPGLCLAWVA